MPKHGRIAWLKGGQARCEMSPRQPLDKAWRIVLLGASGAGEDLSTHPAARAHLLKFPGCIEAKTGDGSGAFPRTASANNCKQIVNLRKALPPLINQFYIARIFKFKV